LERESFNSSDNPKLIETLIKPANQFGFRIYLLFSPGLEIGSEEKDRGN